MLHEHELRVPLARVLRRIEHAGQPAQIGVEGRHLVVLAHRLQAGAQHHVRELHAALVQLLQIPAAQVEGEGAAIKFVCAADQPARFLHITARLLGRQGLAHGLAGQMVEVGFEHVLRRRDQRQAHHRVLGHLVEERVDRITLARLTGQVPRARRVAQAVHHHRAVRHAVEPPKPMRDVGARRAEKKALREICAAREFDLAFLDLFGCLGCFRIARQLVEAFPVQGGVAEQCRARVEPAQQPGMDVGRAEALGAHARVRETALQAIADRGQRLLWRQAAAPGGASGNAPIDHHAHAARLPAPGQARHGAVLEQAAGFGDRAQVVREEALVESRESRAARTRLHIGVQSPQVAVPTGFVLRVELHHPGLVVQFVERVLQRVLQRVAGPPQPCHLAALRADRHELVERGDGHAVVQQHAARPGQELRPGQHVHEGRRYAVERTLVVLGGTRRIRGACVGAGRANAVLGKPGNVGGPGIRGIRGIWGVWRGGVGRPGGGLPGPRDAAAQALQRPRRAFGPAPARRPRHQ